MKLLIITAYVSALLLLGEAASAIDLSFIDSHVHLNDRTPDLIVQRKMMDQHGIDAAIIFLGGDSDNDHILSAAYKFPDKLLPFVSVSPEKAPFTHWWRTANEEAIVGELDRQLASGKFKGVGELSIVHFPSAGFPETEYSPMHRITIAIMDLISKKYPLIPVMFHCEATYIKEFTQLLKRFSAVKVIWAHGGYAPLFLTERMLSEHQNLTIELSMRTFENHPRSPDYWILKDSTTVWPRWLSLIERNAERFIVGTDASNRSPEQDEKKALSVKLLLAQLSESTRRRPCPKSS